MIGIVVVGCWRDRMRLESLRVLHVERDVERETYNWDPTRIHNLLSSSSERGSKRQTEAPLAAQQPSAKKARSSRAGAPYRELSSTRDPRHASSAVARPSLCMSRPPVVAGNNAHDLEVETRWH